MPENITFRTHLLGSISDFSRQSRLPLLQQTINLVELVVLLARYQEEGKKLSPKVYLTTDIPALCSMLPDSESIHVGTSTSDSSGIRTALKKCAPLARDGWMIFIWDKGPSIDYGLFKGTSNPISVLVDDVAMTKNDDLSVVKVFQVAEDCVEIRSNKSALHYIFLDHRQEEGPPPLQHLDNLVSLIASNVKEKYYESIKGLLNRLLFESLRESHGCIIAVTNMKKAPKLLANDGVILGSPIDFGFLVEELISKRKSESTINSKGALLKGMLSSDGILLFDNQARLLGYNCFVKVKRESRVIGGARKRAFSTLKENIGRGLCGVFMQSQDGWTDFEELK